MKSHIPTSTPEVEDRSPTQKISSADRVRSLYDLSARMSLTYQGDEMGFTASSRVFVLGRSMDCDLVVQVPVASRQHARIIYRKGKFVLIDQSTNGTFVRVHGAEEICLLNGEELPLVGEGIISLGRPIEEGNGELIRFSIPHP